MVIDAFPALNIRKWAGLDSEINIALENGVKAEIISEKAYVSDAGNWWKIRAVVDGKNRGLVP